MAQYSIGAHSVFGVALNDKQAIVQFAEAFEQPPYNALPTKPVLYIKTPNTYNQSGVLRIPSGITVTAGPTIGVVLAKDASRVKADQALSYIAGCVVANEYSLPEKSYYRPAIKDKCRDGFMSVGKTLVPLSDIAHLDHLEIRLAINGQIRQVWNTANLVRSVPELIEEITDFMTLHAGDILLIGTPADRITLQAGDEVQVQVDEIDNLNDQLLPEEGSAS